MIILIIIIIILIIIIIILRQLCSFHCNCFVCSMLDLIYSSSILIDSCRCLPGQKKEKKENYYFLIFSGKKNTLFYENKENTEEGSRFPTVLS